MAAARSIAARAEELLGGPLVETVARCAVAAPFVISGVSKLADFRGAVEEVRGLTGIEPAWLAAMAVIATQILGSALLIIGRRLAVVGAAALAGFTILATLYAHAFWLKPQAERLIHQNIFFEHVSIIGGLMLIAAISARSIAR